jgi:septum formation protein
MRSVVPLILASASPRRRELLSFLGVAFTVLPADVDESIPIDATELVEIAQILSEKKARHIADRYPQAAVLGADTIVVLDGQLLGKPQDHAEATSTLQALRGRAHQVITGVSLAYGDKTWNRYAVTDVVMRDYTDEEIADYVASGDPFDKAGSYAIQDRRFRPVDHCEGCYCNVVGLPIVLTQRLFEEASVSVLGLTVPDLPPECHPCPLSNPKNISNPALTW